jgi:hypothetical protein
MGKASIVGVCIGIVCATALIAGVLVFVSASCRTPKVSYGTTWYDDQRGFVSIAGDDLSVAYVILSYLPSEDVRVEAAGSGWFLSAEMISVSVRAGLARRYKIGDNTRVIVVREDGSIAAELVEEDVAAELKATLEAAPRVAPKTGRIDAVGVAEDVLRPYLELE